MIADSSAQNHWQTVIVRGGGLSRMFLARVGNSFDGPPEIFWDRLLSDAEVTALLDSPFSIMKKQVVNAKGDLS